MTKQMVTLRRLSPSLPLRLTLIFKEPGISHGFPKQKPLPNIRPFFDGLVEHIESLEFTVNSLIGDDDTVVALGNLISRVRSTGRDIHSDFAIEVRFDDDGLITKYHMYEDTYAVAAALGRI